MDDDSGRLLGMLTTGAIPIVAIGSAIGVLVAIRHERRGLAIALGLVAALAFAATLWVSYFVFS